MKKLCLIFILLCAVVYAAEPIRIVDFSGGLATNVSPFLLKPNQSVVCTNWDLSMGMLKKRLGYNVIDTAQSGLRLGGIYGYTGRDGTKRLFAVERAQNSPGQTWYGIGKLCQSNPFDYTPQYTSSFTTKTYPRVWQYVYYGDEPPTWTTWKNDVYFANGRQRPLVYHDGYIRLLTPPAPGEPLIVPMADSGTYGGLDGEYRYAILMRSSCADSIGGLVNTDPSLEAWEDGSDLTNWTEMTPTGATLTRQTGASGAFDTWCLRAYTTTTGEIIGIRDTVATTPGSYYRGRAYVKLLDAGSGFLARAIFKIMDSTGNIIYRGGTYTQDEWIKLEYTFMANDSYVEISCYCFNSYTTHDVDMQADSVALFSVVGPQYQESYISQPVKAMGEKVLLTYLPVHTINSYCCSSSAPGYDSISVEVYRTKANPGDITVLDTFFMVGDYNYLKISQYDDTGYVPIDTLRIIDSLPDDSISEFGVHFIDTVLRGRDSAGAVNGVRVGAPTFVFADTAIAYSIFPDIFVGDDTVNVIHTKYICTYYDTLIGSESDSSRSLYIQWAASDSGYTIGLPPIPEYMPYYTRKLYRSFQFVNVDTLQSADSLYDTVLIVDNREERGPSTTYSGISSLNGDYYFLLKLMNSNRLIECKPPFQQYSGPRKLSGPIEYRVKYTNALLPDYDTITTPFLCIAEIEGSDSAYTDTISFDSMLRGSIYWRSGAPVKLNYITAFDDKLWGAVGAYVYWSYLDSGSYWGAFRNIALNPDDGDEITAIAPFREYVKVYKNHSQFVLTPATDGGYTRNWVVEGIGCVAPHSIKSYNNTVIYLSEYGVVSEGAGQYLERASDAGIISIPINDILLNRNVTELRKMTAAPIVDQKYRLTLPDKDTTFVYDLVTGGWSIWTYSFFQATSFDTVKYAHNIPAQDLLFTKKTTEFIYKADTTYADNGTAYQSEWKSAPINISSELYRLSHLGIWRWGKGLHLRLYNEDGDSAGYKLTDTTGHYDIYGLSPNQSGYFQVDVRDNTTADSLRIEAIDIWIDTPTERTRR